jgi:hypothetical protein
LFKLRISGVLAREPGDQSCGEERCDSLENRSVSFAAIYAHRIINQRKRTDRITMLRRGAGLVSKIALVAAVVAAAAKAAEAFHRPFEGEPIVRRIDDNPGRVPAAQAAGDLFSNGGIDRCGPKVGDQAGRLQSLPIRDTGLHHLARGGGEAISTRSFETIGSIPMRRREETVPAESNGGSGLTGGLAPAAPFSAAGASSTSGTGKKRSDGLTGRLAEIATRVDAMEALLNETMKGVDVVLNVISTVLYSLAITCLLHWLFRRL